MYPEQKCIGNGTWGSSFIFIAKLVTTTKYNIHTNHEFITTTWTHLNQIWPCEVPLFQTQTSAQFYIYTYNLEK